MNSFMFFWHQGDVFLQSTGLKSCLAFLEVTSMVLGTNEGEDNNACGHASNENAPNQSVVRHVLWAI